MDRYVVAGALVVSGQGRERANLVIENGKITEWISDLGASELPVFDAQGKLILPGLIDAHTHFHMASGELFTLDDFVYGGKLAAAAGVTSIVDFVEPSLSQDLPEAVTARFQEVRGCPVDYQFHLVIPHRFAMDTNWHELMERYQLAAVKGFTTYQEDGLSLDSADLAVLLTWSRENSGLLTLHAEDEQTLRTVGQNLLAEGKTDIRLFPQSRPFAAEQKAVENVLINAVPALASLYFVHISSKAALETIVRARQEAYNPTIWIETCPQYLVLDESLYQEQAELYTVCPPLRTRADRESLWHGIRDGTVDVVASDHCAYSPSMKKGDSWNSTRAGLPAVDAILPVLVNAGIKEKWIEWEDIVRVTAENPARLFRLKDKGSLTPGSDADFVVIDEARLDGFVEPPLVSRAGYSPFPHVYQNRSWLRDVARGGEFLLLNGKPAASRKEGKLIPLCN